MSYYMTKNFATKIEELRWHFYRLNLVDKLDFIEKLQTRPPENVINYPKYRKFVNECIKNYNTEVRRHNSRVRMQELRAYFRGLNFPTKLEFIKKLQASPPAVKNHPKYRRFTNECVWEYNSEVRRRNDIVIRKGGPWMIKEVIQPDVAVAENTAIGTQTDWPDSDHIDTRPENWDYDAVTTLLDAQVEQMHYYGASCDNCRHLGQDYCENFSRILPHWKERGYNLCQKWEPR